MYTRPASKFEKPWVDAVKTAAQISSRRSTVSPPYSLDVQILVEPPKHKPAKPWPSQHDLDKLVRSTIDGLVQGKALDDDRNVTELHASKRFAAKGEAPGAIVYVATAEPQIVEDAA